MPDLLARITIDPEVARGRPCIRDLGMRVSDVLDLLASGASQDDVLRDHPDLEADDVRAVLRFAAGW